MFKIAIDGPSGAGKSSGQHHDTAKNSLFTADFGGNGTGGQVSHNGGTLGDQHGGVVVLLQNVGGVDGILGGDGVIAHIP